MAKRAKVSFCAVMTVALLFFAGFANCAFGDDTSDGMNSWRYANGELISSSEGANTSDSGDGIAAYSLEANSDGYSMYNWFDQYSRGYCSGVGAYKGIDVSAWQGKIDWAQVQASGVDFAILRCGYGSKGVDGQWSNNVQGCLESGMPFGVYLYSQASSPEEAAQEGKHVVSQLREAGLSTTDLAMPVFFDMEDKRMNGKNYAAIAQAFFAQVTEAGYQVGTYANLNWWNTRLADSLFNQYPKWVAEYNASIGLTYSPMSNFEDGNGIWQFSDYGKVPGIWPNARVDLNYTYLKPINVDHWIKSGSRWWYRHADGSYPANAWEFIEGSWYHFDASGWMQTGWCRDGNSWYYLDISSGAMREGWVSDNGSWYYLDSEQGGAMRVGLAKIGDAAYYFDASGAMATGWVREGGVWHYAASSGALESGWEYINGAWYWLECDSYAMHEGWLLQEDQWYWLADNGDGRMTSGWQRINGTWYLFALSGSMLTGWQYTGAWYYLNDDSGAMETGWLLKNGSWYYLGSSGDMQIGWQFINGAWYYFYESGEMATGVVSIGNSTYSFDSSGAWVA